MLHPRVRLWIVFAALFLLRLPSPSQTVSPDEVRISSRPYSPQLVIRSVSRLVDIAVVVRDSRGNSIGGLSQDDFEVLDNGKKRTLTAFSIQIGAAEVSAKNSQPAPQPNPAPTEPGKTPTVTTPPSRSAALFFDDISTTAGDLRRAQLAAMRFMKEGRSPTDRIAVFTASGGKVVDFTADAAPVLAAIDAIRAHPRAWAAGGASCPRISAYEAYRIVNNDAMTLQAKVQEACNCGSLQITCDVSDLAPGELENPISNRLSNAGSPYGGGNLTEIVNTTKAQASQTWDFTRMVSQDVLGKIDSCVSELAQQPGHRMLLISSGGFLSGDLDTDEDAIISHALHAEVVVNSLDAKGLYSEGPLRSLSETVEVNELPVQTMMEEMRSLGDRLDSVDAAMARFAESTGGLLFRNNNDLDLGFHRLGVVPEYTYLLGVAPEDDGKYHRLKVQLVSKKASFMQARPGYFAPDKNETAKRDALYDEVAASDVPSEVPVEIKLRPSTVPQQHGIIVTFVWGIKDLPFTKQNDRRLERLSVVATLSHLDGGFVTGREATMALSLRPATYERFSKTGLAGDWTLLVPAAGRYRLRTVIQESVQHKLTAKTDEIDIR